ncbi:MAG: ABC transporter permease [Cyclobacteriaceae bacterium]|nr:ABC transporter permease [Cyclobacteriaceae bacterium]
MLKHSFILLYRNFLRAKGFFLINLTGLTAGLACTLVIYLWVRDELQMDQYHEKSERLYEVMENQRYADEIMTTHSTPGVLAEALVEEVPEVEYATTTTWTNSYTLSVDDRNVKASGYHVGKDYFNIFSFNIVQGNPDQLLEDKYAMVISADLAQRLFGTEENVVGRSVELQHEKTFQITGVFDKVPSASSYQFDFVMNFREFADENEWVRSWGNNGPSTYVTLKPGTNVTAVNDKIKDFIKGKEDESNVTLFLVPYASLYLHGNYENGQLSGGRIEYVRLFSVIAIFILLIACINFMNLSTARASVRAKEVGIKKSIGAQRGSLVLQYLNESVVIAMISMFIAALAVWLFLPVFNVITEKHIVLNFDDRALIGWFTGITLFSGLLAGSYPALLLSAFKPAAVLKGVVRGSWSELWARKGLVVFQFFLSVILIVCVLVIYKQIEFVQTKNLGYDKDHLIHFPIEGVIESKLETFLNEVKGIPGVVNAGPISHSLLGRNSNTSGLSWEGKNPDDNILFENVRVGFDAIETMGFALAEGRSFSREFSTDTTAIILNEAAIRVMNLENPIGKVIRLWDEVDLQIIGVLKDFHFQSLHEAVNPLFMTLSPKNTWNIMVRLARGREKEALGALTDFYNSFNPGFTFEYEFQDTNYAKLYAAEQRVATLSGYFAAFAILISCLGIFGLAAFTAARRQKEIGIRKALGCSSTKIVLLLSSDFTGMVLVSIVLGLPASYWLLQHWLSRFAFHVDLEVWFFIVAGLVALLIAWFTVASQALRAANTNPVECLRSE